MFNPIDADTYHLKNFVSKKIAGFESSNDEDFDDDQDSSDDEWSACLCKGKTRLARITSPSRFGPVQIEFFNDEAKNQFAHDLRAWAAAGTGQGMEGIPASEQWMIELAKTAYLKRRLDLKSKNNTVFRLQGDPEGCFHMVRGQPYTLEVEGRLRVSYGQRLVYIHRKKGQ